MAVLTQVSNKQIMFASGIPDSDSAFELIDWSGAFVSSHCKMIVDDTGTDIDFSLDGKNQHGTILSGTVALVDVVHDFPNLKISKIWFRGTAILKFWAWE